MEVLVFLVPLALTLGLIGLMGFLWSLKSGQYDDLEGAGWRAIADEEPELAAKILENCRTTIPRAWSAGTGSAGSISIASWYMRFAWR